MPDTHDERRHRSAAVPNLGWFAVRVKSNFERVAATSLGARNFECFLPTFTENRSTDRSKTSEKPLFPGYFFCRMDPSHRIPVLGTPGVIGIVSAGSRLLAVDDDELASIRRSAQQVELRPWRFLNIGHRVRITQGALAGIEGYVIEDGGGYRLVLQISLLRRAVSLEIDRNFVEPIAA